MRNNSRLHKIIVLCLVIPFMISPPLNNAAANQEKITMAWAWTEDGATDTYMKQIKETKNLDVVSPTGIYLVDDQGTLDNQIDSKLVAYAHQQGKKVWALFGNHGFSKDNVHGILIDPAKRTKVVKAVTDMAVKNQYDGINIDWEGMYTKDKDLFTQFVRELTQSLKAENKVVSVDITVITAASEQYPESNWHFCYDRKALGKIVDYMALMAYDEHNQYHPNGSVSSLPWVEEGIQYLLKDVPAEKIILSVPFYTHDFSKAYPNNSQYIGLDETQRRISKYKAGVHWDKALGQNVAVYYKDGYKHTIWVEDDKSLGLKLDLVNKYNLAGMSAWSLGSEFPSTWDVISDKMNQS